MCWVMPPASRATTSVWRMASSSLVLPWSTWPMAVNTRGGGEQVLLAVGLGVLPALDLLEGVGLARVDDLDAGADLVGEQGDRLVGHRLGGGQHLAHLHEHADQVPGGLTQPVGQVLHGDAAGHPDQTLDRDVGVGLDGGGAHGLELLTTTPAAALFGTPAAAERAAPGTAKAAAGAAGTATEAGTATAARPTGPATATGTTGTAAHTGTTGTAAHTGPAGTTGTTGP